MSDELGLYAGLRYATQVVPERDEQDHLVYVATHPELPGCMSHGNSPQEAIDSLKEAREFYISVLLEKGLDVPLPGSDALHVVWESSVVEYRGPEENSKAQTALHFIST